MIQQRDESNIIDTTRGTTAIPNSQQGSTLPDLPAGIVTPPAAGADGGTTPPEQVATPGQVAGPVQVVQVTDPPPAAPAPVKTGNPAVDVALNFFASKGIAADHQALQLAAEGKFESLAAVVAERKIAGGQEYVNLLSSEHTRQADVTKARQAADRAAMIAAAGSEQQLNAALQWAGANFSKEQVAEINKTLAAGGFGAELAVRAIVSQSGSFVPQTPASAVSAAASGAGIRHISAEEFGRQAFALAQKHNGHHEGTVEYQNLVHLREL